MKTLKALIAMAAVFLIFFLLVATLAQAADVTLQWDAAAGATGYRVQMSADGGATWAEERDAGAETTYVWTGAPDSGLLLFRVQAYNSLDEATRTEAGAWYNGDWKPLVPASGLGVQ